MNTFEHTSHCSRSCIVNQQIFSHTYILTQRYALVREEMCNFTRIAITHTLKTCHFVEECFCEANFRTPGHALQPPWLQPRMLHAEKYFLYLIKSNRQSDCIYHAPIDLRQQTDTVCLLI